MSVTFGGAHYYTNQGNEYKKTNFFKRVGTLAGAAMLLPATLDVSKKFNLSNDVFENLAKGEKYGVIFRKLNIQNETVRKAVKGILMRMQKSGFARYGILAAGLALAAGVVIGAGRLAGSLFDGVINGSRRRRADRRTEA